VRQALGALRGLRITAITDLRPRAESCTPERRNLRYCFPPTAAEDWTLGVPHPTTAPSPVLDRSTDARIAIAVLVRVPRTHRLLGGGSCSPHHQRRNGLGRHDGIYRMRPSAASRRMSKWRSLCGDRSWRVLCFRQSGNVGSAVSWTQLGGLPKHRGGRETGRGRPSVVGRHRWLRCLFDACPHRMRDRAS